MIKGICTIPVRAIGFVLLLALASCDAGQTVRTDETPYFQIDQPREPKAFVSPEAFAHALSEIPKGAKVIVEEEYRDLLPAGLAPCDYYRFYEPYRYPDTRVDPFSADYLLAHESLYLRAILTPPVIWKRVVSMQMPDTRQVTLLKRIEDLDEKILSVAKISGLGRAVSVSDKRIDHPFSIHRFEVSHHEFAAFLNEAQIPTDKVDLYYSLKDPTSKIVHYRGQYRVLKGHSAIAAFNVSYLGAKAFCAHYRMSLPDKDQWLQAAGATDGRPYPWGDQTDFHQRGNFRDDGDGFVLWAPVDAFPKGKSPYGAYNMAGNLYEWVSGTELMGGCMEFGPEKARLDQIEMNAEIARNIHDGFRCVTDD